MTTDKKTATEDCGDPGLEVRRLLWMATIAAGGELRLKPRDYPGDGQWSHVTRVETDAETGEIIIRVAHFGK